eukprot:6202985-Pleurochrysis_carterae.AAC.4
MLRWLHSRPKEREPRCMITDVYGSLGRATSLSCARSDSIHRMFNTAVNSNFSPLRAIHGSRMLGLAENVKPTLVTHVSHVDLSPAFNTAGFAPHFNAQVSREGGDTPRRIGRTAQRRHDQILADRASHDDRTYLSTTCFGARRATGEARNVAVPTSHGSGTRVSAILHPSLCFDCVEGAPKQSSPEQAPARWTTQRRFHSKQRMHLAYPPSRVRPREAT